MIGLKRGTVILCDHQEKWEIEAQKAIAKLKEILGDTAKKIEHVGSTAIKSIKAKPIIDIMLSVDSFSELLKYEEILRENFFYYRPSASHNTQLLFGCGSFYDGTGDIQTHFIHAVLWGSQEERNYISFRDYLNTHPEDAKKYEELKISLANKPREEYTKSKNQLINRILQKALALSYLGKELEIKIDRPLGSTHPKHKNIVYPVNYGYIPNQIVGDGEELDVYLLGVNEPVSEYKAKIIAVIYRLNDNEDKLVACPSGISFTKEQIIEMVHFQEQYFQIEIEKIS